MLEGGGCVSTGAANKRRLVELFDTVRAGDVEKALGLLIDVCDPDLVVHEPPFTPWGGDYYGRDAFLGLFAEIATSIDFSQIEVLEAVGEGDKVVMLMRAPVRGAPEAEPMSLLASEWYSFKDGRVVDIRPFYWEIPPALDGPDRRATADAARATDQS
jgi:ketosteroid isomerase-like protein